MAPQRVNLWAISDIHIGRPDNLAAMQALTARPDDWLILGGDVGDTIAEMKVALDTLGPKFKQLLWVPGNHELWSVGDNEPTGVAKYDALVELCRSRGVLTPEDPFVTFEAGQERAVLALLFVLYDYSFGPKGSTRESAIKWALEHELYCADERLISPAPYPTIADWCSARVELSQKRLAAIDPTASTVLINHYPLLEEHAFLPLIPRFKIWCGTARTRDWHQRYRAKAVVYGHLHIRSSHVEDGVRFEEVSLGYPKQWSKARAPDSYLRRILPSAS